MNPFYGSVTYKVSHYLPNGDGRDQYISSTNGGFFPNAYPYRFKGEGRTMKRYQSKSVPRLDAKALKYNCNGSGRDTYVGVNNGGFISSEKKYSFYTSLRFPALPSPSLSLPTLPSPSERIWNKKIAESQKNLVGRLSMPKKAIFGIKKNTF